MQILRSLLENISNQRSSKILIQVFKGITEGYSEMVLHVEDFFFGIYSSGNVVELVRSMG
jgi:hypothetical protein